MNNTKFNWIFGIIIAYLYLLCQDATFANIFLVIAIPAVFIINIFTKKIQSATYKSSVSLVDKQYIFNQNTIKNDNCTVRYVPDEKITVTDNINTRRRREIRTFTVTNGKGNDVNKYWNQLCKIFDGYSSIDSLSAFLEIYTEVKIILVPVTNRREEPDSKKTKSNNINIDSTSVGAKFVEMNDITPDSYSKDTGSPRKTDDRFVDITNIPDAPETKERKQEEAKIYSMNDALSAGPNKIDVNSATSSELAILPGINIVGAKKIVEHRDTNGLFTSVDEFIEISGVKSHFVDKIKSMITIGTPKTDSNNDNNDDEGRIIDF